MTCAFLLVLANVTLAQTPSDSVDLHAPYLAFYARLPQYPIYQSDLFTLLKNMEADAVSRGDVSDGISVTSSDEGPFRSGSQYLHSYRELACLADAVVVGRTDVWLHHIAASHTYIYTDYDFVVDKVIKNNERSPLGPQNHIVITRPGGSLPLGTGRLKWVNVQPPEYPHLQANTAYLLFLRYIPETGGYFALGPLATLSANFGQCLIVRKKYSGLVLPDLEIGALDKNIPRWSAACEKH